jgi:riboflavin synthase
VFTGIVQDMGRIERRELRAGDLRLTIGCERLDLSRTAVGDSICVQGCCLTAIELRGRSFVTDISRETLNLTTLGTLAEGARVNLEPSLRLGDELGGHLVSGHIDGIAQISALSEDARSRRLIITPPPQLLRYLARKGSVTLDGVSLTVNEVDGTSFGVNIIPHTQAVTTLGTLRIGSRVNLEVDLIARYLERLTSNLTGSPPDQEKLTS